MPENGSSIISSTPGLVRRLLSAALALPLATGGLLAGDLLAATPARAATIPSGPTASVTLGDSYISGEAGRWKGNSADSGGSRTGTDRAWTGSSYDPGLIYGATAANGCDRSDVAEVLGASTVAQKQINLACSGAVTTNIFRASNGGQAYKGEAPQADQLATVAAQNNIKLITLSIGGNDLGFASVISNCVQDYLIWYSYCHDSQQSAIDSKMPTAMAGVGKAIDEIRAVMSDAGYAQSDYRLVLQSYPSPIPRSAEMRYPESGWSRSNTGGCPFWDADADWARDSMVPQISTALAGVAASKGVQFLDLSNMLQGREVCSTATQQPTASTGPSATTSEWARFLDGGFNTTQGVLQESMHPDYYGQLALGRCLTLLWGQSSGDYACRNTAGRDASGMYLVAR
ncbi:MULTISPECIES: GDSL-type esterase/lipase family protein [Kitasatospora]|uniref:GDSL-type esterase/lipase family protein n=1 Tax=Kitasatospora cathayae TaxID=3004092 RepID=A0ABY7PYX3_9ACTN|nr:GDSL-type esterase/lipase family protein [Kitasatospora sp. HUAS 3-15]WBP85652.1 GDSL-type esterase/lipase family protein [Kitasatospora sp. HUAS 3-15]